MDKAIVLYGICCSILLFGTLMWHTAAGLGDPDSIQEAKAHFMQIIERLAYAGLVVLALVRSC